MKTTILSTNNIHNMAWENYN